MKLQFVFNDDIWGPVNVDVVEIPTDEIINSIENDILELIRLYESTNGELDFIDFNDICYEVVGRYCKLDFNNVAKTIYINY